MFIINVSFISRFCYPISPQILFDVFNSELGFPTNMVIDNWRSVYDCIDNWRNMLFQFAGYLRKIGHVQDH